MIAAQVTPAVGLEFSSLPEVAYIHHHRQLTGEQLVESAAGPAAGPSAATGNVYTCGLCRVRDPEVWDNLGVTGSGVVVGVIDTGFCKAHADIVSQLWLNPCEIPGNNIDDDQNGYVDDIDGWNFAEDNANVNDANGHGSHVAGTVAGDGASAKGLWGRHPLLFSLRWPSAHDLYQKRSRRIQRQCRRCCRRFGKD